ncbi:MAG TPA: hypothetical protein VFB21_17035 [Chthonomonadaceae bacterium]|nr:hypothetical protein [Chthonomonadaceae bacterium]
MSVQEIERAVAQLSPTELQEFAEWFADYQAEIWDKQIEADVQSGRLDALIAEAHRDFEAGRCKAI